MLDPHGSYELAATGLNASPGAATGEVVFDAATAERRGEAGESVILVRWETTPDDYYGMRHAAGILTAHGGLTSHAAVVARGEGIPCVTGCDALSVDPDGHRRRSASTRSTKATRSRSTAPPAACSSGRSRSSRR